MALIIDPDNLNQGTEVTITTSTKKIKLNLAGNLSSDGVTLKCLYSFLKEEWKNDADLIKFAFPIQPITDEQFELINGWDLDKTGTGNSFTPNLIRNAGWALKDNSGVSKEEYCGVITLGDIGSSDQVYYKQSTTAVNIIRTGAVNQAVKIYGDASNGNFDYRSSFQIFVREYQKIYASSQLSNIGVTTMTYQVYRFPLSNSADLKITHNDASFSALPYSGMSITWYAAPQTRSIGGVDYDFHVIIDGNSATAEEIYEFVQYSLRQNSDIDSGAGTKTGKIASEILRFVGDTLYTLSQTEGGVFIDNYQDNDINRLIFVDDTSANIQFPFVSILTLQFGDNLKNDADAIYKLFFTNDDSGSNTGRDFGTSTAIVVQDNATNPISGSVTGQSSISFTYNYDGNVQRGAGSAATDAPVTAVGIGLTTGQYVSATGTITRSISNSISLVAPLERNYSNV